MAKRGRKKKFKFHFDLKPEVIKSLSAATILLVAAISLVSFFFPDYEINSKIQDMLKGTFGYASILIPFILALIALQLLDSIQHRVKELRVLFGLILLLFSASSFFGLMKGSVGGSIGTKLSDFMTESFSKPGSALISTFLTGISLILLLNISVDQVLDFIKLIWEKISSLREVVKKPQKDDVQIIVSSDFNTQNEDAEDFVVTASKDNDGEKFEIIPTMSEPQAKATTEYTTGLQSMPVVPNLPYTDKVWELPPLDLLAPAETAPPDTGDVQANAKIIKETLRSFGIDIEVADIQIGPSVTKYALEAPPGVKVSRISNLQFDLALALASSTGSVRIEAPIPGKSLIGIEVPNKTRALVSFKSLIISDTMKNMKSKLGIVLGKDVGGSAQVYDIGKMPHLLIAGATGSGKSFFIHNILFSILFRASPQEVKFILIDPKRVELKAYEDIPHLYTPIVTDIEKAPAVFSWAVSEMTRRYKLFESAKARNIEVYNEKSGFQALPYIVIVVDEFAEIMVVDPAAVEKSIVRLAQLARATGIHLILAAQRPSANIITGLIKANIPTRIAFNVTGQVDSRVIIDQVGAEKLLGKGDMLFVPPDRPTPERLQGAFISDKEISNLVSYLKSQGLPPDYREEIFAQHEDKLDRSISAGGDSVDPLYEEAVDIVMSAKKASASLLQRRLSIGYARAARILDELEQSGVVGIAQGSKPRDVLLDRPLSQQGHGFQDLGGNIPDSSTTLSDI